jgi:hypothetical protein
MDIKGDRVQCKGIGNIFNKVLAENFPNLEREMSIQAQKALASKQTSQK